jgi:hypothetical protein
MEEDKRQKGGDYSRGYSAGRKRTEMENAHWLQIHTEIHHRDVSRKDAFFCAALTGLIARGGWQMDGNKVEKMAEYVELARRFANKSMEVMKP